MKAPLFKPIYISSEDSATGPRVGGKSPVDVIPTYQNHLTRYLCTFSIEDSLEVTVFHSFDFFNDGASSFHDNSYLLHQDNFSLIELIVHEPSLRGQLTEFGADVSGRLLIMADDWQPDELDVMGDPYPYHKTGGLPAFTHEFDSNIRDLTTDLLSKGYSHIFQLAPPSGPSDGVVEGDWPFGDAIFHILGKKSDQHWSFITCWG